MVGNPEGLFLEANSKKLKLKVEYQHCVKSVCIRSFSGPYFPAFRLNTERLETPYPSVFSPNGGRCRREKLQIWTLFTQCRVTMLASETWAFNPIKETKDDCSIEEIAWTLHINNNIPQNVLFSNKGRIFKNSKFNFFFSLDNFMPESKGLLNSIECEFQNLFQLNVHYKKLFTLSLKQDLYHFSITCDVLIDPIINS